MQNGADLKTKDAVDRRTLRWSLPAAGGLILLALLAVSAGCGGGSGGDGAVVPAFTAQFSPSGTPAGANVVRLTQAVVSGDLIRVNVVVGGVTSSSDLYSYAFDLVISDPTVAAYVDNSAQAGTALQTGATQGLSVLVEQNGNRVVVGVSKLGGGSGNGVGPGEATLVSLAFRVTDRDSTSLTFAGSSANPTNPNSEPVALDSDGDVVGSLVFDDQDARLIGL